MMISVYSHYLDPIEGPSDANEKPSKTISRLRNAYNQGVKGIIENARVFALNDGEIDDEILYEIWRNEELHKELQWANKNIVLILDYATYKTIGVRLRILTGKLNKLVYEGKLSPKLNMKIHNNFVTTISDESSAIRQEDLPF